MRKKLKFIQTEHKNPDNQFLIHYDHKDNLFAKEHMGQYLIVTLSKKSRKSTSRVYLSYKPHKEYFEYRRKSGKVLPGSRVKPNNLHLLDRFPKHNQFIHNVINTAVPHVISVHLTEDFLRGFSIFLLVLDYLHITLTNINEITNEIQKKVIENLHKVLKYKNDRSMVRYFFGTIEIYVENFIAIDIAKASNIDKSIEAYPSSVIYQMDYYARKELKRLKKRHLEYKEWIKELEAKELFSIENLAHTYYNPKQKNRGFKKLINHISTVLHGENLKCWRRVEHGKYYYSNRNYEHKHLELLNISKNGKDLTIKNEKMFALWMKTIHPNWPFDHKVDKKYKKIYTNDNSFYNNNLNKSNINYHDFESRLYPGFHEIYPLILLLHIREGINSEVLQEWKVTKTDDKYKLGDQSTFAIVIDAVKSRANSIITTTISKNSEQAQYLKFYSQWITNLFETSNDNYFFQYISRGNKILSWRDNAPFSRMIRSEKSFYSRYKIYDINNKRISSVNHQKIRVSSNYMDYLRGLTEFERQLKKGHRNINTQQKYENSKEWDDQILLKLSKTQNQYVSFFRGQTLESTKKIEKLFDGILCDCSNPSSPDYYGHKSLKSNEACTDWFKCLTGCTKANVIKSIHGPAIVAWKKYMEEQQEKFFRIEDWEKEYLLDYEAAISVLEGFNENEIKSAIENSHSYADVVKMKFSKKVKLTKKTLEG